MFKYRKRNFSGVEINKRKVLIPRNDEWAVMCKESCQFTSFEFFPLFQNTQVWKKENLCTNVKIYEYTVRTLRLFYFLMVLYWKVGFMKYSDYTMETLRTYLNILFCVPLCQRYIIVKIQNQFYYLYQLFTKKLVRKEHSEHSILKQ
jgi:hypothetical protein